MLSQSIFISPTRERARDFVRTWTGPDFIEALTLKEFIHAAHGRLPETFDCRVMEGLEERLVFEEAVMRSDLSHFAFLKNDYEGNANTAEALRRFVYLVRSSGTDLGRFNYPPEKLRDIKSIMRSLDTLKSARRLVDYADMQLRVLERAGGPDVFGGYSAVYYDSFESGPVHLWGTEKEKELYNRIRALPGAVFAGTERTERRERIFVHREGIFSRFNEIEEAARIARAVIDDTGCGTDTIVVAAANLDRYLLSVEPVFRSYGLPVFVSKGVPLRHFPVFRLMIGIIERGRGLEDALGFLYAKRSAYLDMAGDPSLGWLCDDAAWGIRAVDHLIASLKIFARLGVKKDNFARFAYRSLEGGQVYNAKPGIAIQELNQLVHRRFDHVILMGVDSDSLPSAPSGDFLYGARHAVTLFGQNNSYELSTYHVDEVLANNRNVYLVKAAEQDRRILEFSRIILDRVPNIRDLTAYGEPGPLRGRGLSREDLLRGAEPARARLDDRGERYISSVLAGEKTVFDGILGAAIEPPGAYSATQFNAYARCPLLYYFSAVLSLAPPARPDGFEPTDIGIFAHKFFEIFTRDMIEGRYALPAMLDRDVKDRALEDAEEAYRYVVEKKAGGRESIERRMQFLDLTEGLDSDGDDDARAGVFLTFLRYVYGEGAPGRPLDSARHAEFFFGGDGICLGDIPVCGKIDRVDISADRVVLIDYKPMRRVTPQMRADLLDRLLALKEFQLPLYSLVARGLFAGDGDAAEIESFLLTFHGGRPEEFSRVVYRGGDFYFERKRPGRSAGPEMLAEPGFGERIAARMKEIAARIESGDFGMTPGEENCNRCRYIPVCNREFKRPV